MALHYVPRSGDNAPRGAFVLARHAIPRRRLTSLRAVGRMSRPSTDDASAARERAADCVQLANIDARILELELSLRFLREEKAFVKGRPDAYTYPVLTLPYEIVTDIFIQFIPAYPVPPPAIGLLSPTVLGQICRKWRGILWSSPALWRAISLSLGPHAPWRLQNSDQREFERSLSVLETSLPAGFGR
ncbi:hypothetical protein B0H11DRAFT_1903066 [Mycena galericulata]|nr:hypothetical protein B0H11DRAFT_1903066 [Mycena galericulata]